jgi:hypothetical protein
MALWRLAKLPGPMHGLSIIPLRDDEMGKKEAWATATPPSITIRQTRFANPQDPETRFILAHELFHILLHPEVRSFRVAGGNAKLEFLCKDDLLAIYHNDESHEVQANVGARAFLMPRKLVLESPSSSHLARQCNVPLGEAALRFAHLQTAKKSPKEVMVFLAEKQKEERHRLWSNLPIIRGEPPEQTRRVGKFRIAWNEFQKMTECGWTIENGKIVSYFDICAGRLGR